MSVTVQFNGKDLGLGKLSVAVGLFLILSGSSGAGLGFFLRQQAVRPPSRQELAYLGTQMAEMGTHAAVLAERVGQLEESEKSLRKLVEAVTALRVDLAATARLLSETRGDLKDLRARLSGK